MDAVVVSLAAACRPRAARRIAALVRLFAFYPMVVLVTAVPLVGLTPQALAQAPAANVDFLRGKLPRADDAVTALGTDLFGDKVNLYTGSFEIEQTDVELPGNNALRVAVGREYKPGRYFATGGAFGDWDVAVPRIIGTFALREGWTVSRQGELSEKNRMPKASGLGRCTGYAAPPGVTRGGFNPQEFYPWEYWQGTMLTIVRFRSAPTV